MEEPEAAAPYHCLQVQSPAHEGERERILLAGHSSTVYAVVSAKTRPMVFSGSYDRTIKVWDALTCECKGTLVGHKWAVFSLAIWEEEQAQAGETSRARLFSGSGDHTIRVWNIDTLECEKVLEGHKYDIRALTVHQDKLYSGCYDMTIKIWNAATLECLHTITGLIGPPFSLRIHGPSRKLYSAGWNKPIDIFDLSTLKKVGSLSGVDCHQSLVYCLELLGDHLYSGSIDNFIKVWSVTEDRYIETLQGHTLGVNALVILQQYLYSGSDDKTIRVWKLDDDGLPDKSSACMRIEAPHGVKCMAVGIDGRIWAGIESPASV